MTVIVTGGAGFIGSNVVDGLVAAGEKVVVIDNISTGRRENLEDAIDAGAVLIKADVREVGEMQRTVADEEPSLIVHLAAQIDVRVSVSDPGFDSSINIGGTISMLEAARQAGVARFINISTGGAMYGSAGRIPTPESEAPAPFAPYGQSKLAAEGYCGLYRRLHGLSTINLRLGNVYGPRQDPLGEAGVIAIFCGRLRDGKRPTVYGDGSQTRDFVYVGDVVRAVLDVAESEIGGSFNIATGKETSVLELVHELGGPQNSDWFKPHFEPPRPGEAQRSVLDCSKAREELGWEAQVELAEGLHQTLASV